MDKELIILEQIQNNPHINQRDLATVAKASLGMTNAILKRFAEKGFVTIKKVNNRNIRYVLTTEGIEEINQRSWRYFKRTIKNVVVYQDALKEIFKHIIENYSAVLLIGDSDLDFMIEHLCYKNQITFEKVSEIEKKLTDESFYFYSENYYSEEIGTENLFHLKQLIIK